VQADAFAGPVGHRGAGELGAVVAAQHGHMIWWSEPGQTRQLVVLAGEEGFEPSVGGSALEQTPVIRTK
jgi:hypothetical protein